jgi:uncharacterized protein YkwD
MLVPVSIGAALSLLASTATWAQTPTADDLKRMEDQVFALVNQRRAEAGLAAYSRAPELDAAARRHSSNMATTENLSHTGTDGSTFDQRIKAAGYPGDPTGENIAWGYSSAEAVMNGWMNSTGHRANILSQTSNQIGISVVFQEGSEFGFHWTQVFGFHAGAPAGGGGGVTAPETLINADFSQGPSGFALNGDARLINVDGRQILSLTQNAGYQTGVVWSSLRRQVPSFSFIADIRIRHSPKDPNGNDVLACPADGVALTFAPVDMGTVGVTGGSLGIFGVGTFTAFEINTWQGQGLGNSDCTDGRNETFAFDVVNANVSNRRRDEGISGTPDQGGAKIGQALPPGGLKIVNGGWYRYQWNALADGTMEVYVTGLEAQNQQFRRARVLNVRFPNTQHLGFEGRFGLSAATGGAVQHTDVAACRVVSPAVGPQ